MTLIRYIHEFLELHLCLIVFYLIIVSIFFTLYFFFNKNGIYRDYNEVTLRDNIKVLFAFLNISTSSIWFTYFYIYQTHLKILLAKHSNLAELHNSYNLKFLGGIYNHLYFGLNQFNISFIILLTFLYPVISFIMGYDYTDNNSSKSYVYLFCAFNLSYILLIVENIVIFYIIYELILILVFSSMYLSSNSRGSLDAIYSFICWALVGSIFVGIGMIFLMNLFNQNVIYAYGKRITIMNETFLIYFLFFIGFGVKLSLWPFWYWLPKAHVEVSTGMSIYLSCILIKISLFSLLKFQHYLNSEIPFYMCIAFSIMAVIEIVFRIISLKDLKAILAYSSVLHTNLLVTLVHLDSFKCLKNSIYYIWGHSISTAIMFTVILLIELRYSTRNILYITGLWESSPQTAYLLILSLYAFIDIPSTLFFWGELWLWVKLLNNTFIVGFQILLFVAVLFMFIFFKNWWNVLFGASNSNVELADSNSTNHEILYILVLLIVVQTILGLQPSYLSFICGIFI